MFLHQRERNVGSCLMGIDATMISSAINLKKINTNLDLVEKIDNEDILPSSVLLQRDCKDFYNVQTNKRATFTSILSYMKKVQIPFCTP